MTGREQLTALALAEVAAVLAQHGGLICQPTVEEEDGQIVLTVTVHPQGQATIHDALCAVELLNALQYLRDMATLRALAARYDIAPEQLEALLPKDHE